MNKSEKAPSFQFYVRDWLSDDKVRMMTPEERGGYIDLLAHAWLQSEPGTLPDDDGRLAALSGLYDRWHACRGNIRAAFRVKGDRLVQKRMVNERAEQKSRHDGAVAGGLRSAEVRAAKRLSEAASKQPATTFQPLPLPLPLPLQENQQQPIPTPPARSARSERVVLKEPDRDPPPGVEPQTWRDWFTYRYEIKKPLTATSAKACWNKLKSFYDAGHDPDEIVQSSIANNWQGVFIPKEELGGPQTKRR